MSLSEIKTEPSKAKRPPRLASVDTLRGITILLMVFVNDLGQAAPSWMHHIQPTDADGMTLADVVFPFFLFIAGVSIPLAFQAARKRGDSSVKTLGHVLVRTVALLLMGLIEVNRAAEINLGPDLWGLLGFLSIIFVWAVIPKERSTKRTVLIAIKVLGVIGLVTAFATFRREPVATSILFVGEVESWQWLRTEWWGILGLIGWAYLASALVYWLVGSRREWLMAALAFFMLNFLCSQHGGFFTRIDDKAWLSGISLTSIGAIEVVTDFVNRFIHLGTQLGTLPATMMAGCLLGKILEENSGVESHRDRISWALKFAAGLFLAAAMTDTFAGINKIGSTPTWCFLAAGLATLLWVVLYIVMDVKGWIAWSAIVRPAGANPLIAYLLHPILIFVLTLTGLVGSLRFYASSPSAVIAILGSVTMAFLICGLVGAIAKAGLRIRV